MKQIHPIFFLDIADIHMEAVLDIGFWNNFSRVSDLHSHTYYELMLCPHNGFQIVQADGTVIAMETDEVCLIPPRVYHRLAGVEAGGKLAIRFFCTRNLRTGALYHSFLSALEGITAPMHLGKQPEIMQLTHQLVQELQQAPLAADACVESLLTQLLIYVLRLVCQPQADSPAPLLPEDNAARRLAIEDYFNGHYQEQITEDDLAQQIHLSRRQLSRVLQQLYGMSFRQLLIDIRLNRAAELLISFHYSPEEVAYQVGYTSLSGFYDAFRKRYGISAGRYRQQLDK